MFLKLVPIYSILYNVPLSFDLFQFRNENVQLLFLSLPINYPHTSELQYNSTRSTTKEPKY